MPSPILVDPPRISNAPDVRILPKAGVVIIGAAQTAGTLAMQLGGLTSPPIIAGWIDTGSDALCAVEGLARLGTLADLPLMAVRFKLQCAVICLPSSHRPSLDDVVLAAREIGLDVRVVPPIEDLLTRVEVSTTHRPERGATAYQALPTIDLGELIGRTPHALDRVSVGKALTGKRVLITGAGGSIGSELARVAASFAPEQIILMERAENALFEIDRQIARRHPMVARKAVLHDVVDEESTLRLLSQLRPHVVFHAAAHKHVPLMEDHPGHAITNNLFGTKSIADAAVKVGAERFVMISSDKAVNPTSVMGATKRMAEMYVRGLGGKHAHHGSNPTRLSMVRFGNVLGSACSVLTIWSTQIAEALGGGGGGQSGRSDAPLTITDPRMTRFFMTIPEAATLVVQSMVVGQAGKSVPTAAEPLPATEHGVGVYVLDMGEPIRILELAGRFIKANGAWPRIDAASAERLIGTDEATRIRQEFPTPPRGVPTVDVIFTGARPGEKLHEELAYAAEMLAPTDHPGVRSWAGPGFGEADAASVQSMVAEMASVRYEHDRSTIINAIRRHVPEMRPL